MTKSTAKRTNARKGRMLFCSSKYLLLLLISSVFLPAAFIVRMVDPALPAQAKDQGFVSPWMPHADLSAPRKVVPVQCVSLLGSNITEEKNDHRMFLRYTVEEPHFWISLHEKNYDPVRWQVMHYGKYYEQKLVSSI